MSISLDRLTPPWPRKYTGERVVVDIVLVKFAAMLTGPVEKGEWLRIDDNDEEIRAEEKKAIKPAINMEVTTGMIILRTIG